MSITLEQFSVAPATDYPSTPVVGLPIACMNYEQVLDFLETKIRAKQKTFVVTMNLDILRLAHANRAFYTKLSSADFIFADGMPILWLSRLANIVCNRKTCIPERVAGCDIVQDLFRLSHERGYTIYILGAAPGVADQAAGILRQKLPNVQIVGTYAPQFSELTSQTDNARIICNINATNPDILFVALGAPKQENWVFDNLDRLNARVIVPCGGSIDFIAGTQKKCPQWLGKLGVEWLYRMAYNPGRLFPRYVLQDIPFLARITMRTILA